MTIRYQLAFALAACLTGILVVGPTRSALSQADAPQPATSSEPTKDEPAKGEPAQEEPAKAAGDKTQPEDTAKPKDDAKPAGDEAKPAAEGTPAEQYAEARARWDALERQIQDVFTQLFSAPESARPALKKQYGLLAEESHVLLAELRTKAMAAYAAKPNEDKRLSDLLIGMMAYDIRSERKDDAEAIFKLLEGHDYPNHARLGVALFGLGWTDQAAPHLLLAEESGEPLNFEAKMCLVEVKEAKIREAEAKADDLPRVRLKTSKGDVVLELFENEAPGAVGNFISLVEDKFYNGLTFHRVIDEFMAQGGCPNGDGTGGPGYKIYCECEQENHRNHLRGSLSMAHAGKDSGGSQFFITFVPRPDLDGKHTVFGRVIEGMENVDALTRRTPDNPLVEPDKILEAEVIRKRDHEYKPNKVVASEKPAAPEGDEGK